MVGDGALTWFERLVSSKSRKVHRLDDGRLLGIAGKMKDCLGLIAWLNGSAPRPKKLAVSALLVSCDGRVELIVDDADPVEIEVPAAVGSGSELAIGAMLAGASPMEAVQIACSRDPFSGGQLIEEKLHAR